MERTCVRNSLNDTCKRRCKSWGDALGVHAHWLLLNEAFVHGAGWVLNRSTNSQRAQSSLSFKDVFGGSSREARWRFCCPMLVFFFYLLLVPRRRFWSYRSPTAWWQQLRRPGAPHHHSTPPPHQARASPPVPPYLNWTHIHTLA